MAFRLEFIVSPLPPEPALIDRRDNVLALVEIRAKVVRELRVTQRELDGRLQVAELAAAVETRAVILVREHLFIVEQRLDRVGQLQLSACTRLQRADMFEDAR